MTVPVAPRKAETVSDNSRRRPSLASTHGLVVIDALTGAEATHHVVFLAEQLRRDDQSDRLPDGFRLGVTEQTLGRRVPRGDEAGGILADDRVVRGRDDRRRSGLGLGQFGHNKLEE